MTTVDAGSLADLKKTGRLLAKLGTQPVCVLWDGEAAYAVRRNVVIRFEEIIGAVVAVLERIRTVEDEVRATHEIEHVRRRCSAEQYRRRIGGVDETVIGVERNRKERSQLPFECLPLGVAGEDDPAHLDRL